MGIVFTKKVSPHAQLGLWKMDEDVQALLNNIQLSASDEVILSLKKNDARKKEWLAVRNLLKAMNPGSIQIHYNSDGKPFLTDQLTHISISHSADFASVYLNDKKPVGVDIQKIKLDIGKAYQYFLNEQECEYLNVQDPMVLNIVWSAKESVYKYISRSDLDSKMDLCILPFICGQSGTIEVNILHFGANETISVHYEIWDNYVLTRTS